METINNFVKAGAIVLGLGLSAPVVAQTDHVNDSSSLLLEVQEVDSTSNIKRTETQMLIENIMNDPDNFCSVDIKKPGEETTINAWLPANLGYGQELHMVVNKTLKGRGYENNYSYGLADLNGDDIPDFIKLKLAETNSINGKNHLERLNERTHDDMLYLLITYRTIKSSQHFNRKY